MNGLSLFSNVGVAEAYLQEIGVNIKVANEIDEQRGAFYKHLYPDVDLVLGDITKEEIRNIIVEKSCKESVELIIATPPCQGMSVAGSMKKFDERNQLICYAVEMIKRIKPKYVLLENVPMQLRTKIIIDGEVYSIPNYVRQELEGEYRFNTETLVKAMDYGVPQMRERNIFLLVRKDLDIVWEFPPKKKVITLDEALKDVPSIDPYLKEGLTFTLKKFPEFECKKQKALEISKWHYPPTHEWRIVECLLHTPTGESAYNNKIYFPKKKDGTRIKCHYNHYRRNSWNKPSRTITQNSGVISSLTTVHPGFEIIRSDREEERLYSDPRVFTIYEILIISSLPKNWNIPEWASDRLIRSVIGEGIPPLLVKEIMLELLKNIKGSENI